VKGLAVGCGFGLYPTKVSSFFLSCGWVALYVLSHEVFPKLLRYIAMMWGDTCIFFAPNSIMPPTVAYSNARCGSSDLKDLFMFVPPVRHCARFG